MPYAGHGAKPSNRAAPYGVTMPAKSIAPEL
jgi:hypothetical protein